jgi:GMP synthase (glutamine-hydrolysing)
LRKTALAIRHVPFEDLGSFEAPLRRMGYDIRYHDVGLDDFNGLNAEMPDLLVVLGGPIGAEDDEQYPFLKGEATLIERQLRKGRPLLGICLGGRLMARVLGARVYAGSSKEIGFAPLTLTEAGRASCLSVFANNDVLH